MSEFIFVDDLHFNTSPLQRKTVEINEIINRIVVTKKKKTRAYTVKRRERETEKEEESKSATNCTTLWPTFSPPGEKKKVAVVGGWVVGCVSE